MSDKTQKDFSALREWVGWNIPDSGPISGGPQAYDDVDSASGPQTLEDPANLDRLNAYISNLINNRVFVNPFYALNTLWRKLQIIGLNFDLQAISFRDGNTGVSEAPLNQFGGRYGFLSPGGGVSSDDGISNRIPGGLKLVVHYVNTQGTYHLNAAIEHGANTGRFLEKNMASEGMEVSQRAALKDSPHPLHNVAVKRGFEPKGKPKTALLSGMDTAHVVRYEHPTGHKLDLGVKSMPDGKKRSGYTYQKKADPTTSSDGYHRDQTDSELRGGLNYRLNFDLPRTPRAKK